MGYGKFVDAQGFSGLNFNLFMRVVVLFGEIKVTDHIFLDRVQLEQ